MINVHDCVFFSLKSKRQLKVCLFQLIVKGVSHYYKWLFITTADYIKVRILPQIYHV